MGPFLLSILTRSPTKLISNSLVPQSSLHRSKAKLASSQTHSTPKKTTTTTTTTTTTSTTTLHSRPQTPTPLFMPQYMKTAGATHRSTAITLSYPAVPSNLIFSDTSGLVKRMENSPSVFHPESSISSLLCQEGQTSLDDKGLEEIFSVTEDDDEYVKMLLDREINESSLPNQESPNVISVNWIKNARLDATQYILNTRETFGFKVQTAYLAITYLDTLLSRGVIAGEKYWAVRLLAMACLSLAAKMEESEVPLLSEFPGEDSNFESKVIQRMELFVLDTLNWRMEKITPFAFTHYFVSKFCQNSSIRDITSRAEEVILVAIRDEKIMMHHRPSAIAAAATLLIMDRRLTRETLEVKINSLSSSGYLQIEGVFSIYNQMKEMDMEKYKSSNSEMSPLLSPVQLQRSDAMENSSVSAAVSAKRKSLTFTECDQSSSELRDTKRPC